MEENPQIDLAYTGANIAVFAIAALATYTFRVKFKTSLMTNSILFLIGVTLTSYFVYNHANTTPSKYRTFDIQRCATKRELNQRFRIWSRTIHPDKNTGKNSKFTFEEVDSIKDFLADDHKRVLYDKFDIIFPRDDLDETQAKTIYNFVFQRRLFQYINGTFIWVFLTFIMCKMLKELDITNFLLKVLMGKAFVVVYFMYSQAIDECSVLDRVFKHLTIFQQIKHAELVFSFIFGVAAAVVFQYHRTERVKLKASLTEAREAAEKLSGDAPALKELKESLKKFDELVTK